MKMLLLFAFVLAIFTANASVFSSRHPADTTLKAVKHWSEEDFIKQFGKDDTSNALIHYYFDTRKRGKTTMIWSGAATAASITATAIVASNLNDGPGTGEPGAMRGVALAVLGGSVILTFLTIFSSGFISRLIMFSKRNLYKDLLRYHSGRGLQKMIARSRRFRMFLQAERSSH